MRESSLWRRKKYAYVICNSSIRIWEKYLLVDGMGRTIKMHGGGVYEMPKQFLFPIEKHMYTVFTDIITFPTFMVSSMVRDVIKLYNPFLRYVRIIMMVVRNLLPFGKS